MEGLEEEDKWVILLSYSCRVKELHLDGRGDGALHNPVLSLLLDRSEGVKHLFPSLLRFRPSYVHIDRTADLLPMLYSGLHILAVSFDAFQATRGGNAELLRIILLKLSHGAPCLEEMVLFGEGCQCFAVNRAHIKGLSRLPLLQRFVSHAQLEPAAWMNINEIKHLKCLAVTLAYRGQDVTPISKACSCTLPELKTLTLKGSLDEISKFLNQVDLPTICSATFLVNSSFSSPIPSEAVEAFFWLFKSNLPHITSLAFTCKSIHHGRSGNNPFHIDLWTPLSFLNRLEELSIDLGDSLVVVSDTEIKTLSDAVPRLRSLKLRYVYGYSHPETRAMPTIAALAELGTKCPELAYLDLAELRVDNSVQYTRLPVLRHRLSALEISFFHVVNCCNMADFFLQLDRLFPIVTTVGSQDGIVTNLHQEINGILGIRKGIRQNDMTRGIVLN